jgi:WD40 repeat protein
VPRQERSLEEDDGLVVDFARELRFLRERAGRPTYRELSSRAHFSTSALAEAAGGRKLPSLAVTVAFVRACDGDVDEWESRWRECAAELAGPAEEYPDAPYAGLAAFRRGDADRFFGRDRLVGEVVTRVRNRRMVAVFGPSGSGKSSILMAGLLPRVVPDQASGRAVVLTPGPHPLEECAVRLADVVGASPGALRAELAADPRALHLCLRQAVANRSDGEDFVLVVDQFEELFTVCEDPAERAAFVAALTTAATVDTSHARVVLGVRADFYGHLGQYPELVEALRDGQVLVGAMTPEELRQAITGPAEAAGCRVETALVSRLVADATGQPGALPLVSHALRETWRRRRGTVLGLGAYEAAGGIDHALARTADAVFTGLDEERQRVAHQLFLRLTALGDGVDDTKRRVRSDELDESPATAEVLERLATARLITVDGDGIEITHEALIRHWPRLRRWLDDDRDGLRVHRQLTEATHVWEAHDRERGSLLRGVRLTQAENLPATRLTDREREFLTASLAARDQEQTAARRRIRRTRQLVALLAVLLVVACVSLVVAVRAQDSATAQRNAAIVGGVLSDAADLRDAAPALSLQLALAAYRTDGSSRARDAVLNALDKPYASRIDGDYLLMENAAVSRDGNLVYVPGIERTGLWDISNRYRPRQVSDDPPLAVLADFGPDRTVLIKNRLSAYEVWDLRDPREPRLLATLGADGSGNDYYTLADLAYSADGRAAATLDYNGTVRLWDLRDLAHPHERAQLMPAVHAPTEGGGFVEFSPRGDRLAVANSFGTLQVWDVAQAAPRRLATIAGDVAEFTPDGRAVAVADRRGTVQVWDVASAGQPRRTTTFTNRTGVRSLAFSDGMGLLAIGDGNGSIGVWNVADLRHPVVLTDLGAQLDGPWSVMFGPRGDTLVAVDSNAVRIWDIGSVYVSHSDTVTAVRLGSRGDLLATAGLDHAVRLWHVDSDRVRLQATVAMPFQPSSLLLSPDDATLLVGGRGRTQVVDIGTTTHPARASTLPMSNTFSAAAFNPADSTVVLTQADRKINVYDLADPYHPRLVDDLGSYPSGSLAFDPSGTMLAGDYFGDFSIWDPTAPVTSRRLASRRLPYGTSGTFSPDGHTLAVSISDPREVQLWSIDDPRRPEVLTRLRPGTPASGSLRWTGAPPVFSADGRRIAVLDGEHGVAVWDIGDPRHPESVTSFAFAHSVGEMAMSPDGRVLYAAAGDNVVQRRYLDPEDVAKRICAIAYPRITESEWRDHFRDLPYEPPCGSQPS